MAIEAPIRPGLSNIYNVPEKLISCRLSYSSLNVANLILATRQDE